MGILIRNGEIVTATERYKADLWCEGQTITHIARHITPDDVPLNTEVIDATNKFIFPGFIDPHVHLHLPFMGTHAKDTHRTGSIAAVVGGTTCFIEMICPGKHDEPLKAFETWRDMAAGQSACDYSFHMGVTRYDSLAESQLKEIVTAGISSFKVFLAYQDALGVDDRELYHTLRLAKRLGVITTAHCENAVAIAERQKNLLAEGKTSPAFHYESRPPIVEADGTHHLLSFAALHNAHVYIVHLSCDEALRVVQQAKYRGVHAYAEVVLPHLLLDRTHAEQRNFEGAKYVMSPPLRDKSNQDILWAGLRTGLLDVVATDHAPFDFVGQKEMGRGDFTRIPNGIPSIEDRVNLLFTYGVKAGRIDLHQFVLCASTQPAKIFGLFPRKGTIQIGSDADLVIYDPEFRGSISAKTQMMNVDYSAFEGMIIRGRPHVVTVRGQIVARDGQYVGQELAGQMIRREPTHF